MQNPTTPYVFDEHSCRFKSQEPAPQIREVRLAPAVEAAAEEARLLGEGVRLANEVGRGDQVQADPDQLHRMLVNLLRNAREAIEHQPGRTDPGLFRVWLSQGDGASDMTTGSRPRSRG